MTATKLACLLLLVLLFTAWLPNAQAHEDVEVDAVSTEKDQAAGVGERSAAANNFKITGRKMGPNFVKRSDIKGNGRGTANQVIGKGGDQKGNNAGVMNVGASVGQISEEVNDHDHDQGASFVAFNADYHAPRHHPPKNN